MPNTSKSSKKAAKVTAAAKPEFVDAFTPLLLNGVEQLADLQKKTLDIAAQQTSEWFGAWQKAFSYFPVTPPAFIFDSAGQAMQTAIATQKSALDSVVEQTKSLTRINKVRVEAYSKIATEVTTTLQKSVGRAVQAQKKVLEFAGEQNKTISESTKRQLGPFAPPATVIVDSLERGTDAVIEAEKSFLNIASLPFLATVAN